MAKISAPITNKKAFKISNFEYGTIRRQEGKVVVELSKQQVNIETIKQLDFLYKTSDSFLPLEDIKDVDGAIQLIFKDIDSMKMLIDIKQEEYPIKLSILLAILKDNILARHFVSIHPSTIFYHPMEHIQYSYFSDNDCLPYDNRTSNFEKYRALALFVITGFSYEKCLGQQQEVAKVGNDLVKNILSTKNLEELTLLIHDTYNYITHEYISAIKTNDYRSKKRTKYLLIGAIGAVIICSFATGVAIRRHANTEINAMQAKVEQTKNDLKVEKLLNTGDLQSVEKEMKHLDYSDKDISNMYFEQGDFQKSLAYNPNQLEKIIEKIYQNQADFNEKHKDDKKAPDKKDQPIQQIYDLEIKGNTTNKKSLKDKLTIEQAIANHEIDTMKTQLSFIEDKNTALRMLTVFLSEDELQNAQAVVNKFPDKAFQNRYDLKSTQEELNEQKKAISKEKNKDKKANMQKNADALSDRIEKLQKEIKKDTDEVKNDK